MLDLINADAVLDGNIDIHHIAHGLDAVATNCGSAIRQAPKAPSAPARTDNPH
jgi:hypothetical protein